MKTVMRFLMVAFMAIAFTGCASFGMQIKEFLGGSVKTKKSKKAAPKSYGKIEKREYKKMNHDRLQEQAALGQQSGSLWVERGQGAYLFAQNTNRLIGDLVNVEIKGHPKEQIETKVQVIQNLIQRIKEQREKRILASQAAQAKADGKTAPKAAPPPPKPQAEEPTKFSVKMVPSKIVEINKDGSYVVEGDQPFMLGKREYKLVVKGIVRPADFDDQGISAEILLDPKFDIVTAKR
ncbi:MAG: flagellar basal body L-ring protein FlgH [Bdellovibrionales bacterium]|nr:flagellar basal body L-ring protein FlgH [Bdellovibrionales bacterium]